MIINSRNDRFPQTHMVAFVYIMRQECLHFEFTVYIGYLLICRLKDDNESDNLFTVRV